MKKLDSKHVVILIISFVIIFAAGTFYLKTYISAKQNDKILTNSNQRFLIEITQNELNQKITDKESFFVYVGRPSCPDCKTFMPKLEEILSNTNRTLLYYNTEAPASKKQEIRDYLETFNVKSIPNIIFFSDDKVNQSYDCQDNTQIENFIKKFKGEI